MKDIVKQHTPKKHAKSFKYALAGILHALLNEPNFRIHVFATVVIIVLGNHFKLTSAEWSIITIVTAMVLAAELINTVVESVIDYLFKEYHEVAKVVKDVSAGYVLINAIAALIIFVLIFGPRLSSLTFSF